MRAKRGRAKAAGGRYPRWTLCLRMAAAAVALPAGASAVAQPEEALLEFLGSGLMAETGEDWLEFLDSLARADADAAASVAEPVFQGETHEQE